MEKSKSGGALQRFRDKWFGGFDMTWPKVIIFAVAAGILTAIFAIVPAFKNTSFHDMTVYVDVWILFALFIIVNCKSLKDAVLKTFVFFLISQPLVYLLQVPFYFDGWKIFNFYRYWFMVTLLTIPGAAIAWLVTKKNWAGVAALSVATAYLGYKSTDYLREAIADFPYHLLSAVFCLALVVFFAFVLFDSPKHRAVVIGVAAAAFIVGMCLGMSNSADERYLGEGNWNVSIEDPSVVYVEINDDGNAEFKAHKNGTTLVTFVNENGEKREFYATSTSGNLYIEDFYSDPVEPVSSADAELVSVADAE